MRIFLIIIATVVFTVIFLLLGVDTSRLQSNVTQTHEQQNMLSWDVYSGGSLREYDDEDFQKNMIYSTSLGDDLFITTYTTSEVLTSPLALEGRSSFVMQAYSGYFFQSYDPYGAYHFEGDDYEIHVYGTGTWAWMTHPERIILYNLSSKIVVTRPGGGTQTVFPGEKITLERALGDADLQKSLTSKNDLESMLRADSNAIDITAWNYFTEQVGKTLDRLNLQYNAWIELEKITNIDDESGGGLFFFNIRKKGLLDVEDIFERMQKLVKAGKDCSDGSCREKGIKSDYDDVAFSTPDIADDFASHMQSYYQRSKAHDMKTGGSANHQTLAFLMEHVFSGHNSEKHAYMNGLASAIEHAMWFMEDAEEIELLVDKQLAKIEIATLMGDEMIDAWSYLGRYLQDKELAGQYTLRLMLKYLDVAKSVIEDPENLHKHEVIDEVVATLSELRDQIQDGYFQKEGIIYMVKPGLVPDEDEDLDFDIIGDFRTLFSRIQEFVAAVETQNINISVDKESELTKIQSRLRWFECIFSKNPEYIKQPRICRGKLKK